MEKKRINVALPAPLYKRLQSINAKTGVPITIILQQAVNRYLAVWKESQ